jgi:ribonucleoside-triphosphate reductase
MSSETPPTLPEHAGERVYTRLGPRVWFFGSLMVVLGLVTAFLLFRDFESSSYFYLAFYCIPSNTAVTIFPHEPVLILFGKFANLWITAAAATLGTVAAGLLDYAVFVPVVNLQGIQGYKDKRIYKLATRYFMRWPFATLTAAGLLPVPFFLFKFLSFSIHYPLWKYLGTIVVSKFPRYFLLALLGATVPIPTWILIASVAVVLGLYAVKGIPELWKRRRASGPPGQGRDAVDTPVDAPVDAPMDAP